MTIPPEANRRLFDCTSWAALAVVDRVAAGQCIVDVCSNIEASAADLLEIVLREVIHHEHDIEREVRHRDCERAS